MDISKAFDKLWHKGLLYKLESFGISGDQNLFCTFLNDRHQRVVLNGQLSDWAPILVGVPQGSILGPLLCPIDISDLPDNLNLLIKLLADENSSFSTVYDLNHSAKVLNDDLK